MCVIHTAERAVAIWLVKEAPPSRQKLLALVRASLKAAGYAPWPAADADLFTAGDETLLIARPKPLAAAAGSRYTGPGT